MGFVMPKTSMAELLKLPPAEKLDLIEALWDSLEPDAVPMPHWHKDILDEREATDDQTDGDAWAAVKARLKSK